MAIYLGSTEITPAILTGVDKIYLGSKLVWSAGLPVGTVYNFEYTGSVQSVELPKGKYKLQCWGAQGGNVTGTYSIAGSKGGYSEGVLTLTSKTTLYIFVGGQGTSYTSSASQTSTTSLNGGWNGGGAGRRTSLYSSGDTDGRSFPRGGGGATDISTVTSSMSYSSGRTNRSSASLLARCIVAGGGAGASARCTYVTSVDSSTVNIYTGTAVYSTTTSTYIAYHRYIKINIEEGAVVSMTASPTSYSYYLMYARDSSDNILASSKNALTIPSGTVRLDFHVYYPVNGGMTSSDTVDITAVKTTSTTSTSTSSGNSSGSQQGGGTSGRGQYPGTQSAAGNGGAFGLGANQASTNYRYCGGGGGGGWYGGGTGQSDSSTSYVNYSGGGSGFVNTAANSSYRPSGYTGLQLDSGTTTAGNTSHPSTSGGTETGHSGNGYARITVIE